MPRDLLPLPCVDSVGRFCEHGPRRSAQRLSRRRAVADRVNAAAWSPNELWGRGQVLQGLRPSEAQFKVLKRITHAIDVDPPPANQNSEAALRELLGAKVDAYSAETTNVAPFCLDLVSWPDQAGQAILSDCLPLPSSNHVAETSSAFLRQPSDLTTVQEQEGVPNMYWDRALVENKAAYVSFLNELVLRNMVTFHRRVSVQSRVGIFVVRKK